jgi:hypothetical protein
MMTLQRPKKLVNTLNNSHTYKYPRKFEDYLLGRG